MLCHAKRSFCPYRVRGGCTIEMFSWQDVREGEEVSNEAVVWDASDDGEKRPNNACNLHRRRHRGACDALIQRRSPSKGQRAARTR